MRQKKAPSKVIGRQAFKGIISPLLLAGSGMSATPEMMSAQYVSSTANTLSPDTPVQRLTQMCPMSGVEGQICDSFPSLSFCAKRKLKESDPSCATLQSDKPECPFNENIKRICSSSDFNLVNQYGQFCSFKKVNGMCLDEYIEREQEDKERQVDKDAEEARRQQEELDKQRREQEEAAEKQRQEQAQAAEKRRQEEERQKEADRIAQQQRQIELEKEWVRTRGCKFYDADIPQSMIDMAKARNVDWWTTSTPCQYAKVFQNSKAGDVVTLTSGKRLKFLGWIPETNPNTELITPLRGNDRQFQNILGPRIAPRVENIDS